MRLIDADKAKIEVANYLLHCVDKGKINIDVTEVQTNLFNIINAQPTAYDVEAVVAELNRFAEEGFSCGSCPYDYLENCKGGCEAGAFIKAIEIVRNGGKDALRGCGNCKHQPEPLTTCDWMKSQTVVFKECPRWERKE